MGHRIRMAIPEDEQKIRELFIEMLQTIYHTEDVEGYESGFLDRYWINGEDRILVAEDEAVVAYLSIEVHHEPEADYIYLDDLSVTESYRGLGIGSALIHEAEAYAKEIGIQHILFHVEKSNTKAFRLYERLGYKVFRDDGNRYMMKKAEINISEERITAEEYIDFLKRTDLGSQYPKERFEERIRKLVKNVSISLIARNDEGMIVGALFGLTDFCYWLYVTDLGVDRDYVRQGIASRLMKTAHEIAGGEKDIAVYLIANEDAVGFYEKIGMKRADDVMQYNHIEWTEWTV
ncbi:GNAT family N-acetyltransferase [Butyrivibrio sp. INlla16]|uniref:GNAT family N-acetyltransferase n=1 Tax=Butyrivibrio sp. INlla16 TaxID=1520807 RepID=UPI000888F704|nr:GNAT family N-acetyltransferase [Butyrivibrio sp. INlla16]SDB61980.1 Ribosomal protein S18 acetylase RimI [Butyrivibrio sp. INlla16]